MGLWVLAEVLTACRLAVGAMLEVLAAGPTEPGFYRLPGPWRWQRKCGSVWYLVNDRFGIEDGPYPRRLW